MSINNDLAAAARRVSALADRVPEQDRPDIAGAWRAMVDEIEGFPELEARAIVADWLETMERRLTSGKGVIARPDPRTVVGK